MLSPISVYLLVCLSVCLCAGYLKKLWTDSDEFGGQVGCVARTGWVCGQVLCVKIQIWICIRELFNFLSDSIERLGQKLYFAQYLKNVFGPTIYSRGSGIEWRRYALIDIYEFAF